MYNGAKHVCLLTTGVDILEQKLCDTVKQVLQSRTAVEHQADIENLCKLMFVRSEQSLIKPFDHTRIDCTMKYIHCSRTLIHSLLLYI